MPFIITRGRVGRRAGMREGMEALLRFGEEGLKLIADIHQVHEEDRLRNILNLLKSVDSLDEVRPLCSPTV